MDWLRNEARFAVRSLARRPGFTTVCVLTLGLGIGANTAIFTVVSGVLLEPMPFTDPLGLVVVGTTPSDPAAGLGSMSLPDLVDLERESGSLTTLVGYSPATRTLTGMGDPALVQVGRVSKGLLSTFRVAPALGRDILPGESGANAARVAVIAHGFWLERFGGGPDALGRTLRLNGIAYEIVGVAPEGFDFPGEVQAWVPRSIDPEGCARGCHTWLAIGRLADGATLGAARAEADAIAARLTEQYPDTNFDKTFTVMSLRDRVVGDIRAGLWLVFGAGLTVLLIACANVANLLLARAESRRGEASVRAALGASPRRLAVAMLSESAALATLGGAAGLLVAGGGVALLRRLSAGTVPRIEMIGIDGGVLLFTLGLVGAVTLLFGLSPALRLARSPLTLGLRSSGRSGEIGGGRRLRTLLTAAEMALAVLLLFGAGLMLRTFAEMYAVDPGFETREITRFTIGLPSADYPDLESVRTFYRELEERLAAKPGVEEVGSVYGAPLGFGRASGTVLVDGRPEPQPWEETGAAIRGVSPHYLQTLRIPLLQGRYLERTDDADGLPVAVVNEAFARENFPGQDPIGERVRITVDMGYGSPAWTIVGVVGNVRARSLTREAEAEIYVPHGRFGPAFMTVSVRSMPGAAGLVGQIRSEVRTLDPDVPLQDVETVSEAVRRQLAPTRFLLVMVGLFAALAVTLAAVGLYGVMAYLVSRRLREIGVRVALGARPAEIVRLVMVGGLAPATLGLLVGIGAAQAGGRLIESVLYGVTPQDPWLLVAVPLLLMLVAATAVVIPATRASRVDPVTVLRAE